MQGNSKIYTPSQPSEFAAEFQGFATPNHLKVYSHLHHNWSLWRLRVRLTSGGKRRKTGVKKNKKGWPIPHVSHVSLHHRYFPPLICTKQSTQLYTNEPTIKKSNFQNNYSWITSPFFSHTRHSFTWVLNEFDLRYKRVDSILKARTNLQKRKSGS